MAVIANLTADQGSSFLAIIDLKDANGLPLDVTGKTFTGQFRKSYTSINFTDFTCAVIDATIGKVSIGLSAATTREVKAGRYVYDVEMTDTNDGTVIRVIEGQLEFTPAVTSPNGLPYPYLNPTRFSGEGSPEGVVSSPPGYSYVDTINGTLYFKISGNGSTGWQAFVQL